MGGGRSGSYRPSSKELILVKMMTKRKEEPPGLPRLQSQVSPISAPMLPQDNESSNSTLLIFNDSLFSQITKDVSTQFENIRKTSTSRPTMLKMQFQPSNNISDTQIAQFGRLTQLVYNEERAESGEIT